MHPFIHFPYPLISFRINTQNVYRNRAASTEVEIIAEAKQHHNGMTLQKKINFPDIKERCDASIETDGTMRQSHQI